MAELNLRFQSFCSLLQAPSMTVGMACLRRMMGFRHLFQWNDEFNFTQRQQEFFLISYLPSVGSPKNEDH